MKKLIALVMTVFLMISMAGCGCGDGKTGSQGGSIQTGYGTKIQIIYSGPPELKINWLKLESIEPYGVQILVVGTLKNVSDQTVSFTSLDFLFDENQVGYEQGKTLSPNKEMGFAKGLINFSETTKVLTVRISGFEKYGSSSNSEPSYSDNSYADTDDTDSDSDSSSSEYSDGNLPPIKDKWTIKSSGESLTLIYREAESAKGKIRFWFDEESKKVMGQNLLDEAIEGRFFMKFTYENGEIVMDLDEDVGFETVRERTERDEVFLNFSGCGWEDLIAELSKVEFWFADVGIDHPYNA